MTAFDRFDPFERRISEAIDEIAAARAPDYLIDILRRTARTSQRPRWTFPERWLPVDTALARPGFARRVPVRQLLLLALVGLLAVVAAAYIAGSRSRVPAPFGPASNGLIAYSTDGDIYVRDTLTATGRVLISERGDQVGPSYSPDGTWLSYVTTLDGNDHFSVARADGTAAREIALIPPTGNAQAAWAPDSRHLGLIYDVAGVPTLSIVPVEAGAPVMIALGDLVPLSLQWAPPNGDSLLIRARIAPGEKIDLFVVKPDGSGLHALGLPGQSGFGPEWTLSGPVWAPDGKAIAFNSVELDRATLSWHFRTALASPDGGGARTIPGPENSLVQEAWPIYSPDGKLIVVHRWTFKGDSARVPSEGWLAVLPADGSAPAHDIGPRIPGGEDTGLSKLWSPDGSRILMRAENTQQVFSIDPVTGAYEELPWTTELPDWQRIALR